LSSVSSVFLSPIYGLFHEGLVQLRAHSTRVQGEVCGDQLSYGQQNRSSHERINQSTNIKSSNVSLGTTLTLFQFAPLTAEREYKGYSITLEVSLRMDQNGFSGIRRLDIASSTYSKEERVLGGFHYLSDVRSERRPLVLRSDVGDAHYSFRVVP